MNAGNTLNVYIDGQNVRHWRPNGLNVTKLAYSICDSFNAQLGKIHYFTGTFDANSPRHREDAQFLGALEELGVVIHARPLGHHLDGRVGEVGVDVSVGTAMIDDFSHGSRGFVVVSNDRDHQGNCDTLRSVAAAAKRPVQVIHAGTNERGGLRGVEYFPVRVPMLARCEFDAISLTNLKDARPYEYTQPKVTPPVDRTEQQSIATIVDLQSLAASAKRLFGRPYLDADMTTLLEAAGIRQDAGGAPTRIIANQHQPEFDLDMHLYVGLLAADCERRTGTLFEAIPYNYRTQVVGKHDNDGLMQPVDLLANTPMAKHVHTAMLRNAVAYALQPRIGAIAIVSDSLEAEPIVDAIATIGRMTGRPVPVLHVHIDPHTHYVGAHDVPIDQPMYERCLDAHNRYKRLPLAREAFLKPQLEQIQALTTKAHPSVTTFVRDEPYVLGTLIAENVYWKVFQTHEPNVGAIVRASELPYKIPMGAYVDLRFDPDHRTYGIKFPSEDERRREFALERAFPRDRELVEVERIRDGHSRGDDGGHSR